MQKYLYQAHIVAFVGVLALAGLQFVASPRATFSEREKRELNRLPGFSWPSVFSGLYMDSLDGFMADHFPQREWLLVVSDSLRSFRGLRMQGAQVYNNLEAVDEVEQDPEDLQEQAEDAKELGKAEDKTDPAKVFKDKEQARNSKGLVVSNGQGIHVFTNEASLAKAFANAIDSLAYNTKMNGKVGRCKPDRS